MTRAFQLLVLAALSGCVSPQQRAAQQQAQIAQIDAADDATCKSYGLTFGTPGYAQCREIIMQQRQANAREQAQANANACAEAAAEVQRSSQNNNAIMAQERQQTRQMPEPDYQGFANTVNALASPQTLAANLTALNQIQMEGNCNTQPGL